MLDDLIQDFVKGQQQAGDSRLQQPDMCQAVLG